MRTDKFTSQFQTALADAQSLAIGRNHQFIDSVHLLSALIEQEGSTVLHLLSSTGLNVDVLKNKLNEMLNAIPQVHGSDGDIHISNELSRALNQTDKLSQDRKDQYISSELFVLALLDGKSNVGKLLADLGVDKKKLEQAIDSVRGGQPVNDPNAEENRQALEKYTAMA